MGNIANSINKNPNTVFIFGAGFSKDAGIPLLSEFIDRMLDYEFTGKANSKELTVEESKILEAAKKIIHTLDGYHGRVRFDSRNIEDILSMLVFDVLAKRGHGTRILNQFNQAIAKTIELACAIQHPGYEKNTSDHARGSENYAQFWRNLFMCCKSELPAIVTLNYDLVLERSLLYALQGRYNAEYGGPQMEYLNLDYNFPNIEPISFEIKNPIKDNNNYGRNGWGYRTFQSSRVSKSGLETQLEILKLHGSLNFPMSKNKSEDPYPIVELADRPLIVPPVFNKQTDKLLSPVWKRAMEVLRSAKRIVFVGYSMPKTDMYMQYFLKAALGPNKDLKDIIVFNPQLLENSTEAAELRKRYTSCFAEQLEKYINFSPPIATPHGSNGNLSHFLELLKKRPSFLIYN